MLVKAKDMYDKADKYNAEHTKKIRQELGDEINKAASEGKYEIVVETERLDEYVSNILTSFGYRLKHNDREYGKTIISWNI